MFKNDLSNLIEGDTYVIEYKLHSQRDVRFAKLILVGKNNRNRTSTWSGVGARNITFGAQEVRHYWVLDPSDNRLPLYFNRKARV